MTAPGPTSTYHHFPLYIIGLEVFHNVVENPSANLPEMDLMNKVNELFDTMCNLSYEKKKQLNM